MAEHEYKVGEIIKTRLIQNNVTTPELICEIVSISKKKIYLKAINYQNKHFLLNIEDIEYLTKDKVGTILYGNKN